MVELAYSCISAMENYMVRELTLIKMHKKLHLLLVEPLQHDAQHTLSALNEAGYDIEYRLANGLEELTNILPGFSPDIILCSHDLPGQESLQALEFLLSSGPDIPFLFLSSEKKQAAALQAIRRGANDLIYKGSLDRLAPAIECNLRERDVRQAHRSAQIALLENQERLGAFIANLPGMAYQALLTQDGKISFPYVSEGSQALLETPAPKLVQDASLFLNMLHKDDLAAFNQTLQAAAAKLNCWNWEGRIITPTSKQIKWINLRCSPRQLPDGHIQWEGVMLNITQSKTTEHELNRSREELRALSLHIQDVREQERLNISREVHDHIGGLLTALKLEVSRMDEHLPSQATEAQNSLQSINELLDQSAAAASNISRMLRPGVLDCFGIVAAIEMEIGEFRKRSGISCELTDTDEYNEPDPELDIAVFRIFQETLTNIIKHAQATLVKVGIRNQQQAISLTVTDNGRGLAATDRHKPHSFGLRGMQERVAHLGGTLDISSTPEQGTSITVIIPRTLSQAGSSSQEPVCRTMGNQ